MRAFYIRNKKCSSFSLIFQFVSKKKKKISFLSKKEEMPILEKKIFFKMGNKWNETSTADMRRQTPIVTQM